MVEAPRERFYWHFLVIKNLNKKNFQHIFRSTASGHCCHTSGHGRVMWFLGRLAAWAAWCRESGPLSRCLWFWLAERRTAWSTDLQNQRLHLSSVNKVSKSQGRYCRNFMKKLHQPSHLLQSVYSQRSDNSNTFSSSCVFQIEPLHNHFIWLTRTTSLFKWLCCICFSLVLFVDVCCCLHESSWPQESGVPQRKDTLIIYSSLFSIMRQLNDKRRPSNVTWQLLTTVC